MTVHRDTSEMSFEEALNELDEIVAKLESVDTPLEQSIELYERGSRLKARCMDALKAAEDKVAKLSIGEDGKPESSEPLSDV